MQNHRTKNASRVPTVRSAVTNGSRAYVVGGNGRSPWSRRRRDLEFLYANDMGGSELLTAFQLGLVATAATLRVELEAMEALISEGEPVDLDRYGRLAGHYRRICEVLGIQRRPRDITPPLADYIRAQRERS